MHLATAVQLQQGKVTAVRVLLRIIIIIIVLYSEDDIRIYVELAADPAGGFLCRLAASVEVVTDSGCAYSGKFRELGLVQPYLVHPQLNGFDKGGGLYRVVLLLVLLHETGQQVQFYQVPVVWRSISLYRRKQFLNPVHRSVVGCLAFDMCHRYKFFASIRSYSGCVPMNRMKTVFIVNFTTAMRR